MFLGGKAQRKIQRQDEHRLVQTSEISRPDEKGLYWRKHRNEE